MANKKTILVGAGHMGGALAAGWLTNKRAGGLSTEDLVILDPSPSEEIQALISKHNLKHIDMLGLNEASEIGMIVLAVKPQMLDKATDGLKLILPTDCAILSILAGTPIKRLSEIFGDRPIIRAMPNTPAAIGAGITVCVANEAGEARKQDATRLLKVTGQVEWVEDERLIGPVTAVSGSGPAYVYLMAEALAAAGFSEGLPRDLADKLARETIIGAGALLASTDKTPQELRRAVTSSGGTTQAALDVLMGGGGGLPELVRQAVNAAERRSRKMATETNGR